MTLSMDQRFVDFTVFGGPYAVEYAVTDEAGALQPIGAATWADWDQTGRLVVAREGHLLAWQPYGALDEIRDFNGQTPDPVPAPKWATAWPK